MLCRRCRWRPRRTAGAIPFGTRPVRLTGGAKWRGGLARQRRLQAPRKPGLRRSARRVLTISSGSPRPGRRRRRRCLLSLRSIEPNGRGFFGSSALGVNSHRTDAGSWRAGHSPSCKRSRALRPSPRPGFGMGVSAGPGPTPRSPGLPRAGKWHRSHQRRLARAWKRAIRSVTERDSAARRGKGTAPGARRDQVAVTGGHEGGDPPIEPLRPARSDRCATSPPWCRGTLLWFAEPDRSWCPGGD